MKKTYLQPEAKVWEIRGHQPLLGDSVTMSVNDGGSTGQPSSDDDVSDIDDLLSRRGNLWGDD